jgi:hypothetical protein
MLVGRLSYEIWWILKFFIHHGIPPRRVFLELLLLSNQVLHQLWLVLAHDLVLCKLIFELDSVAQPLSLLKRSVVCSEGKSGRLSLQNDRIWTIIVQ